MSTHDSRLAKQVKEIDALRKQVADQQKVIAAYELCDPPWAVELRKQVAELTAQGRDAVAAYERSEKQAIAMEAEIAALTAERDGLRPQLIRTTNLALDLQRLRNHETMLCDFEDLVALEKERDALQAKLNPTVLRCMHCDYATELQHVCEQCGERWAA